MINLTQSQLDELKSQKKIILEIDFSKDILKKLLNLKINIFNALSYDFLGNHPIIVINTSLQSLHTETEKKIILSTIQLIDKVKYIENCYKDIYLKITLKYY